MGNEIHEYFAHQGLFDRGGAGTGRCVRRPRPRFGIAPWPARFIFVLLLMLIPGSQILIYPVLWILMPSEEKVSVQPPTPPATARLIPKKKAGTGVQPLCLMRLDTCHRGNCGARVHLDKACCKPKGERSLLTKIRFCRTGLRHEVAR